MIVSGIKFDINKKGQNRLTLYIIKYLIVKTKTDVRQKNSHVFTKGDM